MNAEFIQNLPTAEQAIARLRELGMPKRNNELWSFFPVAKIPTPEFIIKGKINHIFNIIVKRFLFFHRYACRTQTFFQQIVEINLMCVFVVICFFTVFQLRVPNIQR